MEITIYRRHWAGCKHKDDRYHPRCGCSLWFQFNWSGPNTTLDGNKLHRGQNKWSAETRIWSEAQTNKRQLDSELTALLDGKPVCQNVTVQDAVEEWLKFKEQNRIGIKKAKLTSDKLVAWCKENDVILLAALTPERAMRFRTSLPYRTGDSSTRRPCICHATACQSRSRESSRGCNLWFLTAATSSSPATAGASPCGERTRGWTRLGWTS